MYCFEKSLKTSNAPGIWAHITVAASKIFDHVIDTDSADMTHPLIVVLTCLALLLSVSLLATLLLILLFKIIRHMDGTELRKEILRLSIKAPNSEKSRKLGASRICKL